MTHETLPATVDIDEARRRQGQRLADIDHAHKLLTGPAPVWAEPDAFREAILHVRMAHPDASVLRTEGVVNALRAHVERRRSRPHPKDRSAAAIAVRVYAREVRAAMLWRVLGILSVVLPILFGIAGLVMGLGNCLSGG